MKQDIDKQRIRDLLMDPEEFKRLTGDMIAAWEELLVSDNEYDMIVVDSMPQKFINHLMSSHSSAVKYIHYVRSAWFNNEPVDRRGRQANDIRD